jgi:hypothetical protein
MGGQESHDVVVHYVGEQGQQENEAYLDEALLERKAEIAAANSLEGEKQDMATIENRNGQKVQDAEVHADEGHEKDSGGGAQRDSFTGCARDANNALKVFNGNATTEKFSDDAKSVGNESASLCKTFSKGIDKAEGFVGNFNVGTDADLIDLVASLGGSDFGSDGKGDQLTVAGNFHPKSFSLGLVDSVDKLIPILNALAIDRADEIAIFHARYSRRFTGDGLENLGGDGGVAEDMLVRGLLE